MDSIALSLSGLFNFLLAFTLSLGCLLIFKWLYTWLTPHDEWALIKAQKSTAAAWALGGATLGYSIALAGAAAFSVNLIDFLIWALVALLAQLLAFAMVRFIFMPKLVERIENDEVPAGIILCFVSVAIGLLNAACMSP
jgi:putative membrane protein